MHDFRRWKNGTNQQKMSAQISNSSAIPISFVTFLSFQPKIFKVNHSFAWTVFYLRKTGESFFFICSFPSKINLVHSPCWLALALGLGLGWGWGQSTFHNLDEGWRCWKRVQNFSIAIIIFDSQNKRVLFTAQTFIVMRLCFFQHLTNIFYCICSN